MVGFLILFVLIAFVFAFCFGQLVYFVAVSFQFYDSAKERIKNKDWFTHAHLQNNEKQQDGSQTHAAPVNHES